MNDDAEQLAGEPPRAAAGTSKGGYAKVAGGIGAGLLALLGGLAKHGGHVGGGALRHAGEVGGGVVRHAGDLGRGASHVVDGVGRGAVRHAGEIGGASHLGNDLGHGAAGMGRGVSRDIRFGAGLENAPRFGDDVAGGYRPFGQDLQRGNVSFGAGLENAPRFGDDVGRGYRRFGQGLQESSVPVSGQAGLGLADGRDLALPASRGARTAPPRGDVRPSGASLGTRPAESSVSSVHLPAGRIVHAGQHALRPSVDERDRQDDQRPTAQAPRVKP